MACVQKKGYAAAFIVRFSMVLFVNIPKFLDCLAFRKALSVGLRLASLAAKLFLTLYMGRYLSLYDLGLYGIVFSVVMVGTGFVGVRLDFIMGRELVGASSGTACRLIRDQSLFYLSNFLLLGLVVLVAFAAGAASPLLLAAMFVITAMESLAQAYNVNMTSMGSPLLSTFLFFLRSGLWGFAVVVLGLIFPQTRSVEIILIAWAAGGVLGVALPLWLWRDLPWTAIFRQRIDKKWLTRSLKISAPIWLGTIGAMAASSMDRFVVSYYLDMEKVGIVTFYGSFALALLSLIHSGFFAFSYPRLISLHREGNEAGFNKEVRRTWIEVSSFVFISACLLGVILPRCAELFQKPELAEEAYTFWLMLGAVWIRANADVFYYILYVRGRDKPLWLGDSLYLLPVTGANILLVPLFDLPGVGYSAILGSVFLLIWLGWFVFREKIKR